MALYKRKPKVSSAYMERRLAVLTKAARQYEVILICHPDTWSFISECCSESSEAAHFNPPADEAISREDSARLRVPVSGRTLAVILRQTYLAGAPDKYPLVENAMGAHVSEAIEEAVTANDHVRVIIIDKSPDDPDGEDEKEA